MVLFLHAADRPGLGGQAVFELTNAKGGFFRVEDREGQREVTRDFTVGSLGMPGLEFRQDRGPIPLDRLLDSVRGEE